MPMPSTLASKRYPPGCVRPMRASHRRFAGYERASRRALIVLGLLLVAFPAEALTFHRPFGAIGLESSYDDHVSGRADPEVELYPSGNTDWRGSLSLGGGTDVSLDDRWGLYLGGRLRGFRYLNYTDFSGLVGTATAELSGYDLFGFDSFLSYGFSTDGTQSQSHTLVMSIERPFWERLTLVGAGGHFWHRTASLGLDNRGPFVDGGIRLDFPTRTSLSATLSWMSRGFDYGREDMILSGSLGLSQRIWAGTYLRANYRRDQASSNEPGRSFPGNAFSVGTSYYF